jgi:hypothetical protein
MFRKQQNIIHTIKVVLFLQPESCEYSKKMILRDPSYFPMQFESSKFVILAKFTMDEIHHFILGWILELEIKITLK